MIVSEDICDILYKDLEVFGMERYRKGVTLAGTDRLKAESIRIIPKTVTLRDYWNRCFVDINFMVPDNHGNADTKRLKEIERSASALKKVHTYDDTTFRYSVYSHSTEEDTSLKCHYVNIKLLFEILNVK